MDQQYNDLKQRTETMRYTGPIIRRVVPRGDQTSVQNRRWAVKSGKDMLTLDYSFHGKHEGLRNQWSTWTTPSSSLTTVGIRTDS